MPPPLQPAKPATTTLRAMRGRSRGGLIATPDARTEDEQCLRGLADGFLSRMAARAYAPGSVEAHGWALKYFLDWAVSRRLLTPAAFTRPLLEEYQLYLHQFRSERTGAPLAVNTQLARLGVIRRFFAWLCRENIIPANPAADLDLPRKQARLLPKSLAIEEIRRLLALPDLSSPFGARDRALLELFYATGVRRTEMVRLELGDFDAAQGTLHVRRGKGGKSRLLPVGDQAAHWLSHYLAEIRPLLAGHPGERALFLSGYGSPFSPAYLGNWVARQMKKAGIENKGSCHLLRHSCATHMLEGGADIRYIQQMLGHARLDTTQIYTEVSIRALTEAHARSHPHGKLPVSAECPVDCDQASGALFPLPAPLYMPILSSTAGLPASTASRPPENPDESAATRSHAPIPPSGPAAKTFTGILEACGWPTGTGGRVLEYGYRYLDTQLGRWLSRDPLFSFYEKSGKLNEIIEKPSNPYSLLENSPLSIFDGYGLEEVPCPTPRSVGECCSTMRMELGLAGGLMPHGLTFCCDGRLVACSFYWLTDDNGGVNDRTEEIVGECIGIHEAYHASRPEKVSKFPCECGISLAMFVDRQTMHTEECSANGLTIICLEKALEKCKQLPTPADRSFCEGEVNSKLVSANKNFDFHCAFWATNPNLGG